MHRAWPGVIAVLLSSLLGCTSISSDLNTAHAFYRDARYEQSMLWLTELEGETAAMERPDLAHFCYLRGMTAFRLGQREDALHFLVLADVLTAEDESLLPAQWRSVMERTLQEITPTGASSHARNSLRPDTI
jgi:hypothetical protein